MCAIIQDPLNQPRTHCCKNEVQWSKLSAQRKGFNLRKSYCICDCGRKCPKIEHVWNSSRLSTTLENFRFDFMCIVLSKLFRVWIFLFCILVCVCHDASQKVCVSVRSWHWQTVCKFFFHCTWYVSSQKFHCFANFWKVVSKIAHDCQASQETDGLIPKFLFLCASLSRIELLDDRAKISWVPA